MDRMTNAQKDNLRSKKAYKYIYPLAIFTIGIIAGITIPELIFPSNGLSYKQIRQGGYEYINPVIDFETVDYVKKGDMRELESKLNTFVKREKEDNPALDIVSLYYVDLNTGNWIGINEKEKYTMASLMKLPTMIAHFKIAEKDPNHLQEKFVYSFNPEEYEAIMEDNRKNLEILIEGKEYTLYELINQMIIYSDNSVLPIVLNYDNLEEETLDSVFSDLGVTNPFNLSYSPTSEDTLSAREYSSFLRILYNATYLNKDYSSKALEILTKSNYDLGIKDGVPGNVKVANKYGVRNIASTEDIEIIKQFHDCGIIYHPNKPYLLCVMTKGTNITILQKVISGLSSLVYTEVDTTNL